MSRPELKILAYPEPFTKAELQELQKPFEDSYNVELQEITEEGDLFGLDLGVFWQGIVVGTIVTPFLQGFMQKFGQITAEFLSKRFGHGARNGRNLLSPSDVIPLTIASYAPPDYVSDRLKPGFSLKAKMYVNGQGFNQLEAKTAHLLSELEIIADAHSRFWQLESLRQVPEALIAATLERGPSTNKWGDATVFSYPDPPRPIPDFGITYKAQIYQGETPQWKRLDKGYGYHQPDVII